MLHALLQRQSTRLALSIFGTFLSAFSINAFIVPMNLYTGGLLGLCQVIRTVLVEYLHLTIPFDISGLLYLLFNLPIILFAYRTMGRSFVLRTLLCTTCCSVFLSVLPVPSVPVVDDTLTCAVLGGMLNGFACGLILTCGNSSGGLDIIGLTLSKKGIGFTVGKFSISFNAGLYTICLLLFDVHVVIYSVIYTVFVALFVDRVHQQNIVVQTLIFTHEQGPELPQAIMQGLRRGVTYWEGKGAYTRQDMRVLCVCVSKYELDDLHRVVNSFDPNAFFIVQEGVRVSGNFIRRV